MSEQSALERYNEERRESAAWAEQEAERELALADRTIGELLRLLWCLARQQPQATLVIDRVLFNIQPDDAVVERTQDVAGNFIVRATTHAEIKTRSYPVAPCVPLPGPKGEE